MTQTIPIICNLRSGAGQSSHVLQDVQTILQEHHLLAETYVTQYRAHAVELATQLANQTLEAHTEPVIVIGGDGTLHEVVSGLHRAGVLRPILYVPAGTGNDFHRTWQAHMSIHDILKPLWEPTTQKELPIFVYTNHTTGVTDIILNNMGFGLDAEINVEAKRLQQSRLFGNKHTYKLSYSAAIWNSLKKLRPVNITLSFDEGEPITINRVALACLMNTPYLGGGIRLDNLVEPTRFELSLITFHHITFSAVVDLVRRIFVTRDQHKSSHVTRYTGETLRLQLSAPIRSHVDGEDLGMIQSNLSVRLGHYPFYV